MTDLAQLESQILTDIATAGDEAALEALRQEELAVWQQDNGCQQDTNIADIRHDIEQEFADQMRADFPELAAEE